MRRWLRALAGAFTILCLAEIADLAWLYHARATVTSQANRTVALGNGGNTVFSFSFIGVSGSDITVIYTDTSGNQTTLLSSQYALSLNAPGQGQIWGIGGTVTYPLAGSPIAVGTTLTIERLMPVTQTVSSNQGQSFPLAVEVALDLLDMQIQQVNDLLGRAIVTGPNDTCSVLGSLPAASSRANQMLGFDSTGCNPIVAQPSSAPVSAAMQPVVDAASISAARALLGIDTNFNVPVGSEQDWPGLTAPTYWKLEDGSVISRATYTALLAVLAPTVACTITSGSASITGIATTAGWGTGWIIESPGSSALGTGRQIATVAGTSVTISGGVATANASSCQIFPYGTAQDGTFNLPASAGVVYAGLDRSNTNLNSTYCTGNPAYLNASCGAQSKILTQGNLPNITLTPSNTSVTIFARENTTMTNTAGTRTALDLLSPTGGGGFQSQTYTVPISNFPLGGSGTAFSTLQPTRIRNKIIFAGAN